MGEPDALIGRTVSGRYRVHTLIGQGGMGKVYEAQQIPLGRAIALKVLGASTHGENEAEFQKRFFHEASILAKLKSPHTVTVFDYGRDDDIFFIAMELLKGHALDRIIKERGKLSPAHTVAVAMQICRSLREAHAQGVIHRDLKPANVIITKTDDGDEHAKVLDFGLAKRLSVPADDTNPNVVPGSPKYMAPEAIRQETVDGRTDIYALGVMLYQMLTGSVPFDARNPMDILVSHLQHPPDPIRARAPGLELPPSLEHLVMRCMAKAPTDRFRGMQEVIEALRAVAREVGVRAEPTLGQLSIAPPTQEPAESVASPPQLRVGAMEPTPSGTRVREAPQPPRRRAGLWVFLGLLLVAGAGAAAFFMTQQRQLVDAPPPAPPEPVAVAEPEPEAIPPEPDMVISEEDTRGAEGEGETPTIKVTARSVPDGATVVIRGKRYGKTPVTFDWTSEHAKRGRSVMVRFRLSGHEPAVVREKINGDELLVDAVLEPMELPGAELSADEALKAVERRARNLEEREPQPTPAPKAAPAAADEPVLKIRPKEWPDVGDDE
ncbi:MAG: serine/threonine protein kinase [Myxococcales bacterium]|nr:serine/threonine protein kinase [Myxococcales bacterium]